MLAIVVSERAVCTGVIVESDTGYIACLYRGRWKLGVWNMKSPNTVIVDCLRVRDAM